jgi:hypothetical protein
MILVAVTGDMLTVKVCCLGWRPWHVQTRGHCHWREYELVRQFVLYDKNTGLMDVWELNPKIWDRFGWRPLRPWEGDNFGWEPPWLGGGAPSSAITWHFPFNWVKSRILSGLKAKLVWIIYNSAGTSKKTQHFTPRKIDWLMLFREIIAVLLQ